jgi:hypothetical protein
MIQSDGKRRDKFMGNTLYSDVKDPMFETSMLFYTHRDPL